MVVVPLSKPVNEFDAEPRAAKANSLNWVRIAAACTLGASGALLLGGRRRAGLVAAATGTALALLDQQDMLSRWWTILPGYIGEVQHLLTQVQESVDEFGVQREKLGRILGR
jgi:hypothetical protein